jgi:hypothetical protein
MIAVTGIKIRMAGSQKGVEFTNRGIKITGQQRTPNIISLLISFLHKSF